MEIIFLTCNIKAIVLKTILIVYVTVLTFFTNQAFGKAVILVGSNHLRLVLGSSFTFHSITVKSKEIF